MSFHYFAPWYLTYLVLGLIYSGLLPCLMPLLLAADGYSLDGIAWVVGGYNAGLLPAPLFGVLGERFRLFRPVFSAAFSSELMRIDSPHQDLAFDLSTIWTEWPSHLRGASASRFSMSRLVSRNGSRRRRTPSSALTTRAIHTVLMQPSRRRPARTGKAMAPVCGQI